MDRVAAIYACAICLIIGLIIGLICGINIGVVQSH